MKVRQLDTYYCTCKALFRLDCQFKYQSVRSFIMKVIWTVLGAFSVLLVAYLFNSSLPDDFQDRFKLRCTLAPFRLIGLLGQLCVPVLGQEFPFLLLRYFTDFLSHSVRSDEDVHVSAAVFDGVPVWIYSPADPDHRTGAGFLYIHGGGWVLGNPGLLDKVTRGLCKQTGAVVVSVDYRRSPPHKFPAHFDDCYHAYVFFVKHSSLYGVDPERIAIGGESAGGNLAAAVSLKLRDVGFEPHVPKLQVLLYPALQAIDLNLPSCQQNEHDSFLPKAAMIGFWLLYATGELEGHLAEAMMTNNHTSDEIKKRLYTSYLDHSDLQKHEGYIPSGVGYGDKDVWDKLKDVFMNPYFSPLLASDLKGLPRAYVMTMGYDVLRDEGILFVKRLKEAGNDVTHVHYKDAIHAVISIPTYSQITDTKIIIKELHDFIKENL